MPRHPSFEELDFRHTSLGDLILRRRNLASLDHLEIHEIILGDAFLMSSLFTEVEVALATLGLAATAQSFPDTPLDVVVGGLGLGYTARAALQYPHLHSLIVVDYLQPVIEWHQQGLVPLGPELNADPRCRFTLGDFFKLALSPNNIPTFDPMSSHRLYHAILLDIDHSPKNLLHERHAAFYSPVGLRQLAAKLHPGGTFALWSDDPPDDDFMTSLTEVFATCQSHIVSFHNPLQDKTSRSTVYVARSSPSQ